jgi:hypothetical protein
LFLVFLWREYREREIVAVTNDNDNVSLLPLLRKKVRGASGAESLLSGALAMGLAYINRVKTNLPPSQRIW